MCLIATEDGLSEKVMLKILADRNVSSGQIEPLGKKGNGYLKANIKKFINAANNGRNVIMLTDLDEAICASSLLDAWLGGLPQPSGLTIRIAVREVEAWLLADRKSFAEFLGVSAAKINLAAEEIQNPKEYLLRLARKAKRDIRKDLLPAKGALAIQGFGYNDRLGEFVTDHWNPERASQNAPSLARTLKRLDARASEIISSFRVH